MRGALASGCTVVAAILATLGATACDAEAPSFPEIPEPTEALRPEPDRGEVPPDARIADYVLEATLDAETHQIRGKATLTWRNRTKRAPKSLPFHLYMNGFRAEDTAWMRSSGGRHRGHKQGKKFGWGYIDVTAVRLLSQSGEPTELAYAEDDDPSLMAVELPQPVNPGDQVTLELEFVTQLPRVFARTGFHKEFHMVAQWFPKIGVLEERDGWKAHVFTLHDEFYADFGNYEVHLDVPEDMVVGATGIRTSETIDAGRKKLTYEAEMVHDFAWVGDPQFVEHFGEHNGIRIRQLIQPEHVADVGAHMDAQKFSLDSFERRYGPYPWSTITIVHVRDGAGGAGGMEYPTLYTTSDIAEIPARGLVMDERFSGVFTTVHEFGHQYFQGLFASDEHTQPWLDEGMNTMADALAYVDTYGDDPWVVKIAGHPVTTDDMMRLSARGPHLLDPVDQAASDYHPLAGAYGSIVYRKTAALMMTLRYLVGNEPFEAALRAYGDRFRFRHPIGTDLTTMLVEVIGRRITLAEGGEHPVELDVADYLEQALHDTSEVDFTVQRAGNRRLLREAGWHRDDDGSLIGGDTPANAGEKLSELDDADVEAYVVVHRRGGFRVPVELLVEFTDDTRERVVWDGRARYRAFFWPGRRLRMATVDPERKLVLEARRIDNTAYASGQHPDDGLENTLADMAEGLSLASMGVTGP